MRVIGPEGEQLGVMTSREALQKAQEEYELDLIEVAPNSQPPVCRIMDYGKYKYDQQKKTKAAAKTQHSTKLKGVQFKANIAPRDLEIRVKRARDFLEEGDKVKFTGLFRGRQFAHTDLSREQMDRIIELLKDIAVVEKPPSMEGRIMTMVLAPIKTKEAKLAEKASPKQAPSEPEGVTESGKGNEDS